jgi:hypothetical protein
VTGATGPQGPTGPTGPTGPAGADATAYWAVVDDTGSLARGSHVNSTTHVTTGEYVVTFDTNISSCSYVAQVGDTGTATGAPGLTRPRRSSSSSSAVVVETFRITSNGTPVNDDYPFHLAVFCP